MGIDVLTTLFMPVGLGGLGIGKDPFEKKKNDGGGEAPKPQALPQPPSISDAEDKAQDMARKRRAQQSKTVYTSPLGVAGEANVARKTLLGQ